MTERHLLLVDCSGFAYRAFYTRPAMRRESDGEPTGAVLGYMSLSWNMLGAAQADPVTHCVAVFDAPGANFRHKIFPAYKGGRDPARRLELQKQLPLMRPVASVLGMTPFEKKGFEADDVIATFAAMAMAEGIRTTIVSGDKDFAQCVVDTKVEIVDPMSKLYNPNISARRLEADVIKRFGVPPRLVPDVQALAGDSADGIPGVRGIGLSKAQELIRRFGSLDAVLKRRGEIRNARTRLLLARQEDAARLYLRLTTLRTNVKLVFNWDDLVLRPIILDELKQVVHRINPAANIQSLFRLELQNERTVDRIEGPMDWWEDELKAPGQRLPEIPQCGFYQTRLHRNGVFVPARIWREPARDAAGNDTGRDILQCDVGGRARDPLSAFPGLSLRPITEAQWRYLHADSAHARAYRPEHPAADPSKPIDLTKLPAPRNPRAKEKAK